MSSSCWAGSRSSPRSRAPTCKGSPRSPCRGPSSPARRSFARGTRATPATWSARAMRARSAAIRTGAPSRWRRSATVEAIETISVVGVLGPDMRRLMIEHPEISTRLVIALGRRLRESNERLTRQSFQTVQSRVAVVLGNLVTELIAAGQPESDVLVTATQSDLAQLAGSSRESASRFLAVLERAGVVSQGRGKLTVHDPGALEGYVY